MSDKNSGDAATTSHASVATAPVHGIGGSKPTGKKIRVAIVGVGNCASSLVIAPNTKKTAPLRGGAVTASQATAAEAR